MDDVTWDPEKYVCGNYFQTQINESFRNHFPVEPFGSILDVGCGDGKYTNMLASHFKKSKILAIDSSENMIKHANQNWARENLFFETYRIEEFKRRQSFDFVLSFWCLHWTNINLAFPNIFQALKTGGRFYAVFSSFSESSISQIWHSLIKKSCYRDLAKKRIELKLREQYYCYRVINVLNRLSYKQVKLDLKTMHIYLPHIDYFIGLVLTLPFINEIPAEIVPDLVYDMSEAFQRMCQNKYNGKLYYVSRPIFLEAIK